MDLQSLLIQERCRVDALGYLGCLIPKIGGELRIRSNIALVVVDEVFDGVQAELLMALVQLFLGHGLLCQRFLLLNLLRDVLPLVGSCGNRRQFRNDVENLLLRITGVSSDYVAHRAHLIGGVERCIFARLGRQLRR